MVRDRRTLRWIIWAGVVSTLTVGVYLFYTEIRPVVIFGLRDDFAHAIPHQEVPEGISGIKAEDCGLCHIAIYEEWKTSIHSQAYDDPFFQAWWKKDKNIWICLNCHTPLQNQLPDIVMEIPRGRVEKAILKPNPDFDPEFRREGVTCAACHVRDGVILGPYKDSIAPHPTRYDPIFQSTKMCFRCHNVPSGPFQFYRFGPCGTYMEYEGGHYYKEGYICQTCHMPEVERPAAVGGPVRKVRRHLWRGGHDPEQIKRAISVSIKAEPADIRPGEKVEFVLRLTNSGAGHYLPTGDPDRFFTIEMEILNDQGDVLKHKKHTMGRWILWQPVIWELYDNRLAPLEGRDYILKYRLPSSEAALERLSLRATIRYHILTEKAHTMLRKKYGLTGNDPYVFTIFQEDIPFDADFDKRLFQTNEAGRLQAPLVAHQACETDRDGGEKIRSSSTSMSFDDVSGWVADTDTAS